MPSAYVEPARRHYKRIYRVPAEASGLACEFTRHPDSGRSAERFRVTPALDFVPATDPPMHPEAPVQNTRMTPPSCRSSRLASRHASDRARPFM